MLKHLALTVEEDGLLSAAELTKVAAALQKQVVRDFAPIWHVHATVSAFARLEDVPIDYWPVIVARHVDGAAGYHEDRDGQPFSLVALGDSWSLTASHETLEMLADPWGKKLIAGASPKKGQGRVNFLVEVCDPSEDDAFAYTVNGVLVSDFYTPHFFDPVTSAGVRYSYTGAITAPRQVLRGGYLSWVDPETRHWFQQTWFGARPQIRDIGKFDAKFGSYRAFTDYHTPQTARLSRLAAAAPSIATAMRSRTSADEASNYQAQAWRAAIHDLRQRETPKSPMPKGG